MAAVTKIKTKWKTLRTLYLFDEWMNFSWNREISKTLSTESISRKNKNGIDKQYRGRYERNEGEPVAGEALVHFLRYGHFTRFKIDIIHGRRIHHLEGHRCDQQLRIQRNFRSRPAQTVVHPGDKVDCQWE